MNSLLLSLWMWGAVVLDCHGSLEPNPAGMRYETAEAQKHIIGWIPQEDGSLGPVYDFDPWRVLEITPAIFANWAEPVVLAGECAYFRVVAIDAQGNRDDNFLGCP